jgi:hypothetical protein
MTFFGIVQEDEETKELFIEIPEELLQKLDWSEGTTLVWTIQEDNQVFISKKE